MKLFALPLLLMSFVFVSPASSYQFDRPFAAASVMPDSVSSAQEETAPTTSMGEIRSRAGLSEVPVNQDSSLNALLDQYLQAVDALPVEGPSSDDEPEGLVLCGCYLFEKAGAGFNFISPTQFASSKGYLGSYGAWSLGDATLDKLPNQIAEPLLLDSRLVAVSTRSHKFSDGSSSLIVMGKLSDGSPQISVKDGVSMDARKDVTLEFTSPANMTYFSISIRSGGSWLRKYRGWNPIHFNRLNGFAGLRLNQFASKPDNNLNRYDLVRLSWGARYRITAGSLSGEFQTAIPKPPRKSWLFSKSFSGSQRKVFLAAIRHMNPLYQKIIKQVAPYTTIASHSGDSVSFASGYNSDNNNESRPFKINFARSHINSRKFRRELIAHEIAHIVDYAGLDDIAYRVFMKKFKQSGKWRRCKSSNPGSDFAVWPCLEDSELLADQIAYSAAGGRSGVGGYGDPTLISSKAMMKLLATHFHLTSPYDGYLLSDNEWRDPGPPGKAATLHASLSPEPSVRADQFIQYGPEPQ